MSLNDTQLTRLGVNAMGDRLRLNERKNNSKKRSSSLANFDTDDNKAELEGGQSKGKSKKKAKHTNRTWTVTVVCLSNKNADKVPSPSEKDNLLKAGLGSKKIKFHEDDTEQDLLDKINSDSVEGIDNETVGFPQLKGCGGIELLKCNQNSRDLQVIDCTWSVKKLKDNLGNQAKLYISENIQIHVLLKLNEENPNSDSDDLLDPMLNRNDTVKDDTTSILLKDYEINVVAPSTNTVKDDSTSILLKDDEINVVAPATNTDATKSFVNQEIDHADDFCTSIPLSASNMSNSESMVQQEEADICSASPENDNAAQIPSQLHLINRKSNQNSDLDHIIANGIDECLRTEN
ncbi:unnamed protein product [Mytilus edulis]|uniref:Uncharacterized protein n=1 Tax=Mytilus edulis TaxID=6550 RepID=A0A8S3S359_MYTED|nr:unnamed protein product [Mytilus edulis]